MKYYFLGAFLLLAFTNCQSDSSSNQSQEFYDADGNKVIMDNLPLPILSTIPADTLAIMAEQIVKIELEILGKAEAEVLEDPTELNRIFNFIESESPQMSRNCSLKGFFSIHLADGTKFNVDIYPDEDCQYFVFYKNSKAEYAHKISSAGVQYLKERIN